MTNQESKTNQKSEERPESPQEGERWANAPAGSETNREVGEVNQFPEVHKCYCCKLYKTEAELQFIKKTQKVFKVCQDCNRKKALAHYYENRLTILEGKKTYRLDKRQCLCGCKVQSRNFLQHLKTKKHIKKVGALTESYPAETL